MWQSECGSSFTHAAGSDKLDEIERVPERARPAAKQSGYGV